MAAKYVTLDRVVRQQVKKQSFADGRLILPSNSVLAAFLSAHPMNADSIPVTDLGYVDNIITEDIDCEIIDPKALPPPQD